LPDAERSPGSPSTIAFGAALRREFLLAVLIGLHVLLIWILPRFPTQDGPSHLHNADVLLRYGESDNSVFEEYYTLNPIPSPNWTGHLLLAALLSLFPPNTAEKVFLTAYAVLLPVCMRSALGAVRPASATLAVFSLPFVFSWLLHLGFYNYCIGLVLWIAAVAFWLRRGGLWRARDVALFSLLVLSIHFSNAVSLFLLIAFLVIDGVWRSFVEWRVRNSVDAARESAERPRGVIRARLLFPLLAVSPALAAFAIYQRYQGIGVVRWARFSERLKDLVTMDVLVALRDSERVLAVAYAALLFLLVALVAVTRIRRGGLERTDGLWLASILFLVLALVAPKELGGGWLLNHRVVVFAALTAILAAGATPIPSGAARASVLTAAVVSLALLAVRGRAAHDVADALSEYASAAPTIARGSTILGLSFSHRGVASDGSSLAPRIAAFLHASAILAAERGGVDLGNYEANATCFPLRFRPERNPFSLIGFHEGLEAEPPRADFIHYEQRTGSRVEYVVLGGVRAEHDHDLRAKAIFKQVAMSYDKIFVSPGRGLAQVYRHRAAE
jgi:hypothetical protein